MKGDNFKVSNDVINDMLNNQIPESKKKKGASIFIVFLILLIIISLAVVFVYFYLKNKNITNKKEQFIQYLENISFSDTINLEKFDNLSTKIENESSEITIEITGDLSSILESGIDLSKMKIDVNSKNNPEAKKQYSKFELKYKDDNIINFETLSSDEKIGIFSDEILTKYLSSKYSNLDEVLNKFFSADESLSGMNVDLDFDKLKNTKFDLPEIPNEVFEKYINIVNKNVPDTSFSDKKVTLDRNSEKLDVTEYSMSLNEEQAINIVDQFLKTLQSDDQLLDIVLSSLDDSAQIKEQIKAQIEVYINSLYEREIDNNNKYIIKIYGKDNKVYRVSIDLAQKNSINQSSINITYLENESQNGYLVDIVKTTSDVSENLNFTISVIQESDVVGNIIISSDLVSSRKFI